MGENRDQQSTSNTQSRSHGIYRRRRPSNSNTNTSTSAERRNARVSTEAVTVMNSILRSMAQNGRGGDELLGSLARANAIMMMQAENSNPDTMSYERLLEVFGDGSENRGAEAAAIRSLPTCTISNPQTELPEDHRNCSICLEDFCCGDV